MLDEIRSELELVAQDFEDRHYGSEDAWKLPFEICRVIKGVLRQHDSPIPPKPCSFQSVVVEVLEEYGCLPSDFFDAADEVFLAIENTWDEVWLPAGTDIMDEFFAKARNVVEEYDPGPFSSESLSEKAAIIVTVIALIEQFNGSGKAFLSCRVAGEQLGVAKTVAANLINRLIANGALREIQPEQRRFREARRLSYIRPKDRSPDADTSSPRY